MKELTEEKLGNALFKAWGKYVSLFGQSPHGTEKQCNALAVFMLGELGLQEKKEEQKGE